MAVLVCMRHAMVFSNCVSSNMGRAVLMEDEERAVLVMTLSFMTDQCLSAAEMTRERNQSSHRGQALSALVRSPIRVDSST